MFSVTPTQKLKKTTNLEIIVQWRGDHRPLRRYKNRDSTSLSHPGFSGTSAWGRRIRMSHCNISRSLDQWMVGQDWGWAWWIKPQGMFPNRKVLKILIWQKNNRRVGKQIRDHDSKMFLNVPYSLLNLILFFSRLHHQKLGVVLLGDMSRWNLRVYSWNKENWGQYIAVHPGTWMFTVDINSDLCKVVAWEW